MESSTYTKARYSCSQYHLFLFQETCLSCTALTPEQSNEDKEIFLIGLSSGHIVAVKSQEIDKKIRAHKKAVHTVIFANKVK